MQEGVGMIEVALDAFKNRPTTSSFSQVNLDCKHEIDAIILSRLGLNPSQSKQVIETVSDVKNKEFTLQQIRLLTPNDLIQCARDCFSVAISLWILFETLIITHNERCIKDHSQFIDIEENLGNLVDDTIEDLNLSVRTLNVLRKERILTLSVLNRYSREELLDLPNLGANSVKEVEDLLEQRGFRNKIRAGVELNSQIGLNTPLQNLNLSVRTFNALMRSNVTDLGGLMELSISAITDIRNLGEKSSDEIMGLQNRYREIQLASKMERITTPIPETENIDWGMKKLAQEIENKLTERESILETKVSQFSLGGLDFASSTIISRYLQSGPISLGELFRIMLADIVKSSEKLLLAPMINLISVIQMAIEKYLFSISRCELTELELKALLEYEEQYAFDSVDLFEIDDLTLSILGLIPSEVITLQTKRNFFELIELTKTHLVTQELPWEIILGVKAFFGKFETFPNVTGLLIAMSHLEDKRNDEILVLLQQYLAIERPEAAERNALIVQMRIAKETLDTIGKSVGLTRERVRQIIVKVSPRIEEIIDFLIANREVTRSTASEAIRNQILSELLVEFGAVYLSELADVFTCDEDEVLLKTPKKFHKFVIDKSPLPLYSSQWSRDDVIKILRKAGTYYFPLKTSDYEYLLEIGELEGPSIPLIYNKFGTWNKLCVEAGVEPALSPKREYVRLWSQAELISFAQRFILEEGTTGSANGYEDWRLKQHDHVPSVQLILNEFNGWTVARRLALEDIRINKGKAVKG